MKLPNAVPKPRKMAKRGRAHGLQRSRMKTRNAKRKGSSFPKQRDPGYCAWVCVTYSCRIAGRWLEQRIGLNDVPAAGGVVHRCWGERTPAHVGKHRSNGAADRGKVISLCQAAHTFYDEHRSEWPRVTGYTEADMATAAAEYGAAYVAQQGGET